MIFAMGVSTNFLWGQANHLP